MNMKATILVLTFATGSLVLCQQLVEDGCGATRNDWYVQAQEDEELATAALRAERLQQLERASNGEGALTGGWYTRGGAPGSEVISVSGAGYYSGNHTTNGSLILLSTGNPCAVFTNTDGTNSKLLVNCHDGSSWHGLRYWFKPDTVATNAAHSPRIVNRAGDKPVVAYVSGLYSSWVTQWPGPGSAAWRGLKSSTGPDLLPYSGGAVDVAIHPGTGQPWFVTNNGYYVYVVKWNGTDYEVVYHTANWPNMYAYNAYADGYSYLSQSRIAFDTLGRAHITCTGVGQTGRGMPVRHLVWNGNDWVGYQTTPDVLPISSGGHHDLYVYGQSTVMVVAEYASNPYRDVFYTQWTASGWKGKTGYPSDSIGAGDVYMPTLQIKPTTGRPDVSIYSDGNGGQLEIMAYRWDWDGVAPRSWGGYDDTTAEQVSNDNPELTNWFPAQANGGAGNARLVWTTCTAASGNCVPSVVRYSEWRP